MASVVCSRICASTASMRCALLMNHFLSSARAFSKAWIVAWSLRIASATFVPSAGAPRGRRLRECDERLREAVRPPRLASRPRDAGVCNGEVRASNSPNGERRPGAVAGVEAVGMKAICAPVGGVAGRCAMAASTPEITVALRVQGRVSGVSRRVTAISAPGAVGPGAAVVVTTT